jgi:hypothetical protein
MSNKGRTGLTSAAVTGKASVTCQQAAINATTNHYRLLTTHSRGYSGDVTQQDNSTLLTVFGMAVR